jgi:hypothetical protein
VAEKKDNPQTIILALIVAGLICVPTAFFGYIMWDTYSKVRALQESAPHHIYGPAPDAGVDAGG